VRTLINYLKVGFRNSIIYQGWLISLHLLQLFDKNLFLSDHSQLLSISQMKVLNQTLVLIQEHRKCMFQTKHIKSSTCSQEKSATEFCSSSSSSSTDHQYQSIDNRFFESEALSVARHAFKYLTQTSGKEPPLPKLVRFNGDQIFFIRCVQDDSKSVFRHIYVSFCSY